MPIQLGRGVRAWVFPPLDLGAEPQGPILVNPLPPIPGVAGVAQLEITFSVSKSMTPSPNKAKVTLANLSKADRDRIAGVVRTPITWRPQASVLSVDGAFVPGGAVATSTLGGMSALRLEAGHAGVLGQIFVGTITRNRTSRKSPDTFTVLECTDGGFQVGAGVANMTFVSGTPASAVIVALAKVIGMTVAPTAALAKLSGFPLFGTLSATGDPHRGIEDILASTQYRWWIDDGVIWIIDELEILPGDPLVFSERGLPGAIRLTVTPEVLDAGGLRLQSTLAPSIALGHSVLVVDSDHDGVYRVEAFAHAGSNRSGGFETVSVVRQPVALGL